MTRNETKKRFNENKTRRKKMSTDKIYPINKTEVRMYTNENATILNRRPRKRERDREKTIIIKCVWSLAFLWFSLSLFVCYIYSFLVIIQHSTKNDEKRNTST